MVDDSVHSSVDGGEDPPDKLCIHPTDEDLKQAGVSTSVVLPPHRCRTCGEAFHSRNKLFDHIWELSHYEGDDSPVLGVKIVFDTVLRDR